ncbi:MAG: hypothetical protein FD176_3075, partial [Rhodospirillaceae bacterium]
LCGSFLSSLSVPLAVIPAQAGIQGVHHHLFRPPWTLAFAGVTGQAAKSI